MKYKSVVITKKGSPEVLKVIENEFRAPLSGETRIKVLATGVGRTDVVMRYGYYPFAPKIPFAPGYEIIGVVDAVGEGVSQVAVDDRVAALTVYGGYAEYIFLNEEHLVHAPVTLDPAEAVALILNYVTAYQMLHRFAKVEAGNKVLITGANGGVGTALLQLGKLASLTMYATASRSKQDLLMEHGAIPIDYTTQDFVDVIHKAEPNGIDFVLDGIGGNYIPRAFQVLRRGGKLVEYGNSGFVALLLDLLKLQILNWFPNGKSGEFYGITGIYRKDKQPFLEDLPILFNLLQEGKLKPIISAKFPILEAAKANELLESRKVNGKIVLLAPELL
jgi:NADPH:quinone reductase-like Zn-dependent oxidoreductase